MIDIHSHILPGLDDGSRTIEESVQMIQIAAASGTTDIVATPHANAQFAFHPEQVQARYHELCQQVQGVITIHLGCDFHLNYHNLADAVANPSKYTINGQNYLLVELPDVIAVSPARQSLRQLIRNRITPIITHPERNLSVQAKIQELSQWVKDGCLLQITAQSLEGYFGPIAQQAAEALLKARLVHFIASDAHDPTHRHPDLSRAYRCVASRHGSERAQALFVYNPSAVLSGLALPTSESKPRLLSRLLRRRL